MRLGVQACLVDGRLEPGDVEVENGVVVAFGLEGGSRGVAIPGFVDLQVNGFAGIDFLGADADGYRGAADALLETGVTAFQPTFITSSEDDLVAALHALPQGAPRRGPRVLGAHLEGPFLSAARLGTHPARYRCDPDLALLELLVAVPESELGRSVDHEVAVVVGPEVIAGSTRLKAGTAQKLVLNMISTISMVRLGKTYGNLMVDVVATNDKLRARVHRIVAQATGAEPDQVDDALAVSGGDAKVAIVSLLAGIDAEEARARLDGVNGVVRKALEQ